MSESTGSYSERQMLLDYDKIEGGAAQSYGKASGYLASIAGDEAKLKFVAKWMAENPTLAAAIQGKGGGQLTAAGLEAFLKGGETNVAAAALLFDSAKNPRRLAKMLEEYEKKRKDEKVTDFASFLELMAKDKANPEEGKEDIITSILTASSSAPAPEEDGVRPGEGEEDDGPSSPDHQRSFWNTDELFGKKGDLNVFDVDGHIISMNITTNKSDSGATVEQLTICDRTHTSDVTCKSFSLQDPSLRAGIEFQVDDREGSVNEMKLKLQFVPEGNDKKIVFAHGDTVLGKDLSINGLFKYRAQKIRDYGYIVKIGGKEFYVGGEAHHDVGQNTFWSKEELDKRLADPNFSPMDLVPDMVAIAVQNVEGRDIPVGGSIGQVDGKWYDLRWNPEKGRMEVVEGLPPDIPPVGPGGGYDGPSEEDPNGGGLRFVGGPHDGWPDMRKQNTILYEEFNSKLSPEVLEKLRFYYKTDAKGTDKDPKLRIMFNKNAAQSTGLPYLGSPTDKQDHVELIRGEGKQTGYILATQGAQGILYLDLRAEIEMRQTATGSEYKFDKAIVGRFLTATRELKGFKEATALRNALYHAEFSRDDANEIMVRLGRRIEGGQTFLAYGIKNYVEVEVGEGKKYQLWPTDEEVTDGQPSDDDVTETGVILDKEVRTPVTREGFPEAAPKPPGNLPEDFALSYDADFSGPDTRLVLAENKKTKARKWYLFFLIRHPKRTFSLPLKLAFEDPPGDRYPPPSDLRAGKVELPASVDVDKEKGFLIGISQGRNAEARKKGYIAIYDSKAKKMGPNCVDVVMWWGYKDRDEARKECGYDKHKWRQ